MDRTGTPEFPTCETSQFAHEKVTSSLTPSKPESVTAAYKPTKVTEMNRHSVAVLDNMQPFIGSREIEVCHTYLTISYVCTNRPSSWSYRSFDILILQHLE